jgi:hypothetical protein
MNKIYYKSSKYEKIQTALARVEFCYETLDDKDEL